MSNIFKFNNLVWLAAVVLAGCAAFVSVMGLSKLFAGAGVTVLVMMGGLEITKLITATALHRYWDKFSVLMRSYMTVAVIVLISITSMGIYGFLSDSYKQTADKLKVEDYQISVINAKKDNFQSVITKFEAVLALKTERLTKLNQVRSSQEVRLDSLYNKNQVSNANKVRSDIGRVETEMNNLNSDINDLNTQILNYNDSVTNLELQTISIRASSEMGAELGPLIYLSELTDIPMNNIVNYLTLIIMLVFDPLAVILLLAANRISELDSNTSNKHYNSSPFINTLKSYFNDKFKLKKNSDSKLVESDLQPLQEKSLSIPIIEPTNPTFEKSNSYSDEDLTKIKNNLTKKTIGNDRGFSVKIPKRN